LCDCSRDHPTGDEATRAGAAALVDSSSRIFRESIRIKQIIVLSGNREPSLRCLGST